MRPPSRLRPGGKRLPRSGPAGRLRRRGAPGHRVLLAGLALVLCAVTSRPRQIAVSAYHRGGVGTEGAWHLLAVCLSFGLGL